MKQKKCFPFFKFEDNYFEANRNFHRFLAKFPSVFEFYEWEKSNLHCKKVEELFLLKYDDFEDEGVTQLIDFQLYEYDHKK